jgi:hypothetical protein
LARKPAADVRNPERQSGVGVVLQITTIDLLDTSEHASQALATRLADVLSDVGKTSVAQSGDSATLVAAAAFTPVGFDGATGETWSLNQSGTVVYLTIVSFARGPSLVSVGVGSYDQSDQKTAVVALAHQVGIQIGTVVGL